ncbi:nicotinamide/nicotinic acid mononucleotide adenylyltransferase 2-like isoform X2 [Lethenteron reissneri]|uniref:nicotinamide/nicotinic acid mononucleotide adenylyltransferase 2-like isoform X2 n=1 Tax=Lethenteron reissneri TaxID=7753 RepID=UPI002AB5E3FA|nr:nicotinamide/nicotinic acid mononucleotide adenylyltransferase 2-like isoform X2 [Lethenteron reissneri]
MGERMAPHIILLTYGDFNPITKGHLGMFEAARAHLHASGDCTVIGGLIAPCHDSCNKHALLPSHHRLTMCHLAVRSSPWIRVDPWACLQDSAQSARSVLEHHRNLLKQMSGCIFCDVTSPVAAAAAPAASARQGQGDAAPPQGSVGHQPAPRGPSPPSLPAGKPTPGTILNNLGGNLTVMCCSRPETDAFSFIDENANMGNVLRYEEIDMRVKLLCGSDLLESFCIPNLWSEKDLKSILGDFGLVCVPREGHDPSRIIAQSPLLSKYRHNIITVTTGKSTATSAISSTESRLALARGDADVSRLLSQAVIDYILQNRLYIAETGTGGTVNTGTTAGPAAGTAATIRTATA